MRSLQRGLERASCLAAARRRLFGPATLVRVWAQHPGWCGTAHVKREYQTALPLARASGLPVTTHFCPETVIDALSDPGGGSGNGSAPVAAGVAAGAAAITTAAATAAAVGGTPLATLIEAVIASRGRISRVELGGDTARMMGATIRAAAPALCGGAALVSWDHGDLRNLFRALGCDDPALCVPPWPHNQFSRYLRLRFSCAEPASFVDAEARWMGCELGVA